MPPNNSSLGSSDRLKVMPKPEDMAKLSSPASSIPVITKAPIQSAVVQKPPTTPVSPLPKKHHRFGLIIFIILILLFGGVGAYAYLTDMLPPFVYSLFSKPPYSESNLVSGIVKKIADIHSSSYTFAASLYVEPRAAGAEPFTIKMSDDLGTKEKYMRDYTRAQDISRLWGVIGKSVYDTKSKIYKTTYADSLAAAAKKSTTGTYPVTIVDPLTKKDYGYVLDADKKNYKLTVTFETAEAIKAVNTMSKYNESTTTKATIIDGNTVTFTKDSYAYLYLSQKPPKNFFQSLGEMSQYLPPEMNIKGAVTAASALDSQGIAEWKFNIDGSGDMGDLSYKVNVDALKKGPDYYLKVNNIPSFFMAMIPSKNQWYKISPKKKDESSPDYNPGSMYSDSLSSAEKSYTEQKKKAVDLIQKIASFADEEGLFQLKDASNEEKVGNRLLYRYNLDVKKEAIVPFYKKLVEYSNSQDGDLSKRLNLADDGLLNYFESKEFSEVFDYYVKNVSTTLWVDDKGFPAIVEYSIRIVPPPDSVSLKDKQVIMKISLSLSGINEPVVIDAPSNAKDLESAMGGALSSARAKSRSASIKATLSGIVPQTIVIADDNKDSYGTKAFPLGPCKPAPGTLFSNKNVSEAIQSVNKIASSTAMCVSTIKGGKVESWAMSSILPDDPDYSYCVDSTGTGKDILGTLKGALCK